MALNEVCTLPGKSTSNEETTLSLAINPLIRAVQIRQSPRPRGLNMGTSKPDIEESILCEGFSVNLRFISKLLKNHTTIVAIKMTENALCRKSFALSHKRRITFFALGKR